MYIATFLRPDGSEAVGALTPDKAAVLDLAALAERAGRPGEAFRSMLDLIDAGEAGLDLARRLAEDGVADGEVGLALADVTLRSPVPVPRQLRDFMVFETHIRQSIAAINRIAAARGRPSGPTDPASVTVPPVCRERPIHYKGNRFSVVGTDADVLWPSYTERLDFELEFGVFIGRAGRDIPAARAAEHIFGYAIFNDFSARDAQGAEMEGMLGPAKGKDFDTGNAIGPWIATPDEVGDAADLTMSVRVNGETWATGNSRDMMHGFPEIIAYTSRDVTLHPGEFLGSGTVGNGCGLELDRWLKPGDVVELEVERIGVLRNRVVRR